MPGGVNSPVRAFKSVGGQPIVIDSVKGSRMWDIDGNEYIDYVGSWGPAIIGHADDEVLFFLAILFILLLFGLHALLGHSNIINVVLVPVASSASGFVFSYQYDLP